MTEEKMSIKDIIGVWKELYGYTAQTVGTAALFLFALSLYPPLSFIPKAFVLFVLTH